MIRRFAPLALVALALECVAGCKKSEPPVLPRPAPSASATPVSPLPTDSQFSLPIAGARVRASGIAAGLVAAEKVVRAERLSDDGKVEWTRDLFTDVTWSPQTELHAAAVRGGVAFVWRGWMAGKRHLSAAFVSDSGTASPVFELGSSWCATQDGIVSAQPTGGGETVVSGIRREDASAKELTRIRSDAAVSLVCGDHRAFAMVDADDDLGVVSFGFGDGETKGKIVPFLRHKDFARDEEREREPFTVGDTFWLLRIGASGAAALRELGPTGPAPWRKLQTQLGLDDELVAIDGDGTDVALVFSRDAGDACPNDAATAVSVHAVRVDLTTAAESVRLLSPAKCGARFGPFAVAASKGRLLATWAELGPSAEKQSLGATAIAWRSIAPEEGDAHRLPQTAEAIGDVSCEDNGPCFAFALVRPTGFDGGTPEPIRMVRLP